MTDPNSYGYRESATQLPVEPRPPGQPGVLPSEYKFAPDELRVLGECNRESFFQRSLPLGTTLGLGTYVAVQNGKLKGNPRFGAIPKVTLAVMVGYFMGKLSYQEACAEKLMALPGSYIGQLLRERKEGKIGGGSRSPISKSGATMLGANPSDIYSDAGPGSSLDLDTDRPLFSEDAYRPGAPGLGNGVSTIVQPQFAGMFGLAPYYMGPKHTGELWVYQHMCPTIWGIQAYLHDPKQPPDGPTKSTPHLSYDDLRRKNRDDYTGSKQDPYRTDPGPPPPYQRGRPSPPPPVAPTNKYGDTME